MKIVQTLGVLVLSTVLSACACSKSGRGGAGDAGMNGDNIPGAEAGDILKDVNFAFDSSALSESAKATLRSNTTWIQENAKNTVTVEGHCDERGTNEYNMALGERRAKSVADFYRSLGVADSRLSRVSYGEELPLDPAHNESAWAKNRRGHSKVN